MEKNKSVDKKWRIFDQNFRFVIYLVANFFQILSLFMQVVFNVFCTSSSSHNKSNAFSGFCSYFSGIRNKIHHIGQQNYDDFIATVVASHAASKLVPNGLAGFHNFSQRD